MTIRSISRRNFLKAGCLTGTVAGLALCGGGIALHPPVLPPIELASFTYGEKTAGERLLVVYASFAGKFGRRGAAVLLPGLLSRLVPSLDFRDWRKIRAWSQSVSI